MQLSNFIVSRKIRLQLDSLRNKYTYIVRNDLMIKLRWNYQFEIGFVNPMLSKISKNVDIWVYIGYKSCGMGWNLSQTKITLSFISKRRNKFSSLTWMISQGTRWKLQDLLYLSWMVHCNWEIWHSGRWVTDSFWHGAWLHCNIGRHGQYAVK